MGSEMCIRDRLIFVICTDFKYTWGDYWKRHNGRENNQGKTKFFSLLLLSFELAVVLAEGAKRSEANAADNEKHCFFLRGDLVGKAG